MHSAVGFLPREEPFGSGRTLQVQTKASSWRFAAGDTPGGTALSGLFLFLPPPLPFKSPAFFAFRDPRSFAVRGLLLELVCALVLYDASISKVFTLP